MAIEPLLALFLPLPSSGDSQSLGGAAGWGLGAACVARDFGGWDRHLLRPRGKVTRPFGHLQRRLCLRVRPDGSILRPQPQLEMLPACRGSACDTREAHGAASDPSWNCQLLTGPVLCQGKMRPRAMGDRGKSWADLLTRGRGGSLRERWPGCPPRTPRGLFSSSFERRTGGSGGRRAAAGAGPGHPQPRWPASRTQTPRCERHKPVMLKYIRDSPGALWLH